MTNSVNRVVPARRKILHLGKFYGCLDALPRSNSLEVIRRKIASVPPGVHSEERGFLVWRMNYVVSF